MRIYIYIYIYIYIHIQAARRQVPRGSQPQLGATAALRPQRDPTNGIGTPGPNPKHLVNRCFF